MNIQVYGIKNCNTMKKTFQLLEKEGIAYEFIDYKKQKPSKELLETFNKKASLDQLVNKKGTTYRKLSEDQKIALETETTAFPLIIENSSMIKRPIVQFPDGELILGLQEEKILKKAKK
jgi:Spx/MgsR family transcriptional regulator